MAKQKFLTLDLETGKRILKSLEASLVSFDPSGLEGKITANNLQDALKAEVLRAAAAEGTLTSGLQEEISRAKGVEEAIKALIGEIGETNVKAELTRIEALITTLETTKVDTHIKDSVKHITGEERTKWNKVIGDLATETGNREEAISGLQSTVEGKADKVHTHKMVEITDLADAMALKANVSTVNSELAKKVAKTELFSNGKVKTELLPSIAVNSVQTAESSEAAMELTVENGDVVIVNPTTELAELNLERGVQTVSGTFICVDATKELFEERFRQLYSNSDSISKADVEKLIQVETSRATEAEGTIDAKIELEKNEGQEGSLAHKIKANANAIAEETSQRTSAINGINGKINIINGAEGQAGSIAHAVKVEKDRAVAAENALDVRLDVIEGEGAGSIKKALVDAKAYTDGKISEVNQANSDLTEKVTANEAAIATLKGNDSTVGSVAKTVKDAVAVETSAREEADNAIIARIRALEAGEAVVIKFSKHESATVGKVVKVVDGVAHAATQTDDNAVGIVVKVNDSTVEVAVMGKIVTSELVAGKTYYLADNGALTTVVPTQVGKHIIVVGKALTTTDLLVRIEEAIEIKA